jgi:hypothetical protein
MGRRWCDVTVETADGKRHTITVLARSVYWAANEFYSRSLSPKMGESLPALSDDTVFEVRALYRVEHKRLRPGRTQLPLGRWGMKRSAAPERKVADEGRDCHRE